MSFTIKMDASGRLVLPKAVRERLNLAQEASLSAEVVAGRIELTPLDMQGSALTRKGGIVVLKRTGASVDAAAAVVAERESQEARGLRR